MGDLRKRVDAEKFGRGKRSHGGRKRLRSLRKSNQERCEKANDREKSVYFAAAGSGLDRFLTSNSGE